MILIMLTATQTFAAVEAFVARAIAHGDLAAVRTARRVLLVGDHLRERGGPAFVGRDAGLGDFRGHHVRVVGNRQQFQFYGLLQRVHPDFIIIRHNGLAPLASRLGIPAIPLGDEHHALGYQGMVNLGESILDVLAHKKFHQDLAAHTKLPYKRAWLEQKDPFVLSRPGAKRSDESAA